MRSVSHFAGKLLVGVLAVLCVASGYASDALAQQIPARLDAYIVEDSVAIGERFTLIVSAEHGFNVNVEFPRPDAGPLIFGDVQVVGEPDIGDRYLGAEAPGMRIDSIRYTATTFELDSARVPSLPVDVILAGGDTLTGATQPLAVPVFPRCRPTRRSYEGWRRLLRSRSRPGPGCYSLLQGWAWRDCWRISGGTEPRRSFRRKTRPRPPPTFRPTRRRWTNWKRSSGST